MYADSNHTQTASAPSTKLRIRPTDFRQGSIGNCWFFAPVKVIAALEPRIIADCFARPGQVGLYTGGAAREWVAVRSLTYDKEHGAQTRNVDWPWQLEAAASKLWGSSFYSPAVIHIARFVVNTFTHFGDKGEMTNLNVGYSVTAFRALTGLPASTLGWTSVPVSTHALRNDALFALRSRGDVSVRTTPRDLGHPLGKRGSRLEPWVEKENLLNLYMLLRGLTVCRTPMAGLKPVGNMSYHWVGVLGVPKLPKISLQELRHTTVSLYDPNRYGPNSISLQDFYETYFRLDWAHTRDLACLNPVFDVWRNRRFELRRRYLLLRRSTRSSSATRRDTKLLAAARAVGLIGGSTR